MLPGSTNLDSFFYFSQAQYENIKKIQKCILWHEIGLKFCLLNRRLDFFTFSESEKKFKTNKKNISSLASLLRKVATRVRDRLIY